MGKMPYFISGGSQITSAGQINDGVITPIKLALNSAQVIVGSSANQGAAVTLSGDVTNDNAGAVTIANNAVTNVKVSTTAAIAESKLSLTSRVIRSVNVVTASTALTTTSTSYVAMTGVTVTFTPGASDTIIMFLNNSEGYVTASNGQYLIFREDTTTKLTGYVEGGGGGATNSRMYMVSFTAASAASHTYDVQWKVVAGTGGFPTDAGYDRTFIVLDVL